MISCLSGSSTQFRLHLVLKLLKIVMLQKPNSKQAGMLMLTHSAYSLDLALCDVTLFPCFKKQTTHIELLKVWEKIQFYLRRKMKIVLQSVVR